jgi:thiamine transport system ATP-binding protein
VLALRHVSVCFDGTPAVDDVSLDLPTGDVLAVLGPSGSGKSTLLRAVAGLEPLTEGSVTYDGRDLATVPTHRRGFALMFQDGQLFPHQSVAGNVGYPLRIRRVPAKQVAARVGELLELVGLPGFGERGTAGLSGGERQRVALARALAVRPRLLLLDEPLSALDRGLRERLSQDLRQVLVAAGTTALLVTHDQEEAFAVADRLALMRSGRVVQAGAVDEVWRRPVDAEAARFLGYATVLDPGFARRLLAAAGSTYVPGPLALRRSALRVSADGGLRGRVLEVRMTPELVRLQVDVEGIGPMPAVASLPDTSAPDRVELWPGHGVRMVVDLTRTAPVGAAHCPPSSA